MILHRLVSLIRRATSLLPARLGLRVLTAIDKALVSTEPENIHLPRLVARSRNRLAVDVGANNGVTTEIMAGEFLNVHAFEANPRLLKGLENALPGNVRLWHFALSSRQGEAVLSVPVSAGVTLEGWGSLETPLVETCERMETCRVETRTLDSFRFEDLDFIKIDVEGHELEVLAGAVETIKRCHPWVVVEALGANQDKARGFMKNQGYGETTLKKLCGIEGRCHNLIFVPSE